MRADSRGTTACAAKRLSTAHRIKGRASIETRPSTSPAWTARSGGERVEVLANRHAEQPGGPAHEESLSVAPEGVVMEDPDRFVWDLGQPSQR